MCHSSIRPNSVLFCWRQRLDQLDKISNFFVLVLKVSYWVINCLTRGSPNGFYNPVDPTQIYIQSCNPMVILGITHLTHTCNPKFNPHFAFKSRILAFIWLQFMDCSVFSYCRALNRTFQNSTGQKHQLEAWFDQIEWFLSALTSFHGVGLLEWNGEKS